MIITFYNVSNVGTQNILMPNNMTSIFNMSILASSLINSVNNKKEDNKPKENHYKVEPIERGMLFYQYQYLLWITKNMKDQTISWQTAPQTAIAAYKNGMKKR